MEGARAAAGALGAFGSGDWGHQTAMRLVRLLAACLLVLALAGCGGGGDDQNGAAPGGREDGGAAGPVPIDQGTPSDALDRLVIAAGAGDAEGMWAELSSASQERYGSLEEFRGGVAAELEEGLGAFTRGWHAPALDETVNERWSVAAIIGQRDVEGTLEDAGYAAPAVLEGGTWKLHIGGPLALEPQSPTPETTAENAERLEVGVTDGAQVTEAKAWVDNLEIEGVEFSGGRITAPLRLDPGSQLVVVFASTGDSASAVAWTLALP